MGSGLNGHGVFCDHQPMRDEDESSRTSGPTRPQADEDEVFAAGDSTEPQNEEVALGGPVSDDTMLLALRAATRVALAGLIVGLIIVLAGVVVILLGVSGQVSWTLTGAWGSSRLQTGAVGVVIVVIGLLVIFFTRLTFHGKGTHK